MYEAADTHALIGAADERHARINAADERHARIDAADDPSHVPLLEEEGLYGPAGSREPGGPWVRRQRVFELQHLLPLGIHLL